MTDLFACPITPTGGTLDVTDGQLHITLTAGDGVLALAVLLAILVVAGFYYFRWKQSK